MYEYECLKCGHRFERIQKFSDKPISSCPKCKKGKVKKLISSSAVLFKGAGFYATDYASKGGGKESSGQAEDSAGKAKEKEKEKDKEKKEPKEQKEQKEPKKKEATPKS